MGKSVHEHEEGLVKPGNEDYMSYYVYQGEWKPTKSVGLIGAQSSSPGPAIVNLPPTIGEADHDPRKTKAPAFKIGEKPLSITFGDSPGPAAYNVRKITNKGTDVCHAPVIGEKIEGLETVTSPGPAAYNRGDSDKQVYTKTPAYTMRPKTERVKGFIAPAPSNYTLPDTLGPGRSPFKKSPCYTIAERLDKTGTQVPSPGPAAYELPPTDVNKPRAPAFSMRTKEKDSKIVAVNPGPASNYYEMVKFHKPSTPRYTFGIRHTPFEAFQHFAPGD